MELTDKHREYWRKNLFIVAVLMVIWFVVTYAQAWFARDLNTITLFGWPLSFYMAAQGSLIIYVWITWYYARAMGKLDDEFGVAEADD